MRIGNQEFKTVFFFGAGATRGALKHVLHKRKRIKPPLNSDFFKIAETYARAEGTRSSAQARLSRLLRIFKRDLPMKGVPAMEEAFSLLFVAKDFPEIYNRGRGRRKVAGVRKEIDDFLHLLFPILAILDRNSEQETGYDRLASALTADDTILTLNYDTLMDTALHKRGWNPKIGYALSGTKEKVDWDVNDAAQSPLCVKLVKLHGSMNWFVRGNISDFQRVFSNKPVKITKPRINEISRHIRQIAPPIYAKIFEHSHWQGLWTQAFRALCDAEILVVVGCSLLDTDFHLRALFSQVARTRKTESNKFKTIYFVDRTKVRRKWQAVLKGSFWKHVNYSSFEKFLKEGVHA